MRSASGTSREQAKAAHAVAQGRSGNVLSRILRQIVHHRSPEKEASIALILAIAEAGEYLQLEFHRTLETIGVKEQEFALLVVLYLLDPVPLSPKDAAYYLGWSRSALLATVRMMEKNRYVVREREQPRDDSTAIALSRFGRGAISLKLNQYLAALVEIEQRLPEEEEPVLLRLCAALRGMAVPPPVPQGISPSNPT